MPTNKSYYKESSEYSDAVMLDLLVGRTVDSVLAGKDPSQTIGDREDSELGEFLEELFGVVMTAADTAEPGRMLNLVFQVNKVSVKMLYLYCW